MVMELCHGGELFDRIAECGGLAEDDVRAAARRGGPAAGRRRRVQRAVAARGRCLRGAWMVSLPRRGSTRRPTFLSRVRAGAWRQAKRYFVQILHALSHCHENRVYHRDLKPENILLDADDNAKVADFGLAAVYRHVSGGASYLQHTKVGSVMYAAPEVLVSTAVQGYGVPRASEPTRRHAPPRPRRGASLDVRSARRPLARSTARSERGRACRVVAWRQMRRARTFGAWV